MLTQQLMTEYILTVTTCDIEDLKADKEVMKNWNVPIEKGYWLGVCHGWFHLQWSLELQGTQRKTEIQMKNSGPQLESNRYLSIAMQALYRLHRGICSFPCLKLFMSALTSFITLLVEFAEFVFRLLRNVTLFICVYIFTLHFNKYRNTTQYWPRKTSIEFLISVFSSVVYSIWTRRWLHLHHL